VGTDNGAIVEKRHDTIGVNGRGHHDETKIVARAPRLSGERNPQIGVNAPLVEFVENDGSKCREERILLKAGGQNTFGRDQNPRLRGKSVLQSNMPADLAADCPSMLGRNPTRDCARGGATRLQQEDSAVCRKGWRYPRRLPRSWISHDHDRSSPFQRRDDFW
jgi:hypothetical protein